MDRWREMLRYLMRRYSESRRAVIISILLFLALIYYFAPWLTSRGSPRHIIGDASASCLQERLSRYQSAIDNFDAALSSSPTPPGPTPSVLKANGLFFPYVGNGLIAISPDVAKEKELYLRASGFGVISLKVNYYPTITASIDGHTSQDAMVTQWREGVVVKLQCFYTSGCVSVETATYAHRTRPNVLIQDLRFFNPTSKRVTVELHQTGASDWDKAITRKTKSGTKTETEISVTTGGLSPTDHSITPTIKPASSGLVFLVTIASTLVPQSIDIGPGKTARLHVVTAVTLTETPTSEKEALKRKNSLEKSAVAIIDETLNIGATRLRDEHTKVWRNLWKTGFSVSTSKAEGALNGDRINSTIYYVTSNFRSPIHEEAPDDDADAATRRNREKQKLDLEKLLYFPDRCYSGHHTLQAHKLWREVNSEISVAQLARLWTLTLEKQGCGTMLKAGADGVLEAIVLSIGALKFTNDHLEFGMEPKDLHRDMMSFRRLSYGNATHLNISVHVGEDNKAQIYAALDRSDKNYFACDAGCLDPPVKLINSLTPFPVKKTEPRTAVLYITADKQHMEDLKHAIHVHEVDVAPAHEHHVLALHRHGHHLGGLPPYFWVAVAFLILVFHLFLVKLICNECKFKDSSILSSSRNSASTSMPNRRFLM